MEIVLTYQKKDRDIIDMVVFLECDELGFLTSNKIVLGSGTLEEIKHVEFDLSKEFVTKEEVKSYFYNQFENIEVAELRTRFFTRLKQRSKRHRSVCEKLGMKNVEFRSLIFGTIHNKPLRKR